MGTSLKKVVKKAKDYKYVLLVMRQEVNAQRYRSIIRKRRL